MVVLVLYIFKFLPHLSSRCPDKSVILESRHILTDDIAFRADVLDLSTTNIRGVLLPYTLKV
jgi:hypothetical protein